MKMLATLSGQSQRLVIVEPPLQLAAPAPDCQHADASLVPKQGPLLLQDGRYLSNQTHGLRLQMVTFNSQLRLLGLTQVKLTWTAAGSIAGHSHLSAQTASAYLVRHTG